MATYWTIAWKTFEEIKSAKYVDSDFVVSFKSVNFKRNRWLLTLFLDFEYNLFDLFF